MDRRSLVTLLLAASALPVGAFAADVPPHALLGAAGDDAFLAWLDGFYAHEIAAGWPTTVLSQVLSGLAPDPRVLARNAAQPEFALPVGAYVQRAGPPGPITP